MALVMMMVAVAVVLLVAGPLVAVVVAGEKKRVEAESSKETCTATCFGGAGGVFFANSTGRTDGPSLSIQKMRASSG